MAELAPAVTVDFSANAAYLTLTNNAVEETRELTDSVLVDLDEFSVVVGVEVLNLAAPLPVATLVRDFHVPEAALELLSPMRATVLQVSGTETENGQATSSQAFQTI
ncbi:DUF2283 domain-containing protein [Demequina silvatica]|uniref:DUF2283 domain-containing protein n=1 Tax=Demequina silvatica TaxID=1638988 RepID=UPI000783318B|nr:DUF2283 domain-containing protein [Demequina silvatica]